MISCPLMLLIIWPKFLALAPIFWVNYTVQSSDVGLQAISDKYFGRTAWTGNQSRLLDVGDKVELALGCGCPIPGWQSVVSYLVLHGDMLFPITSKFRSSMDAIVKLNNIPDMDVIMSDWVYFIPYQEGILVTEEELTIECWDNRTATLVDNCFLLCLPQKRFLFKSDFSIYKRWAISVFGRRNKTGTPVGGRSICLDKSTYEEIIQMKGYCEQSYKIGQGRFGKVYRGNLKDKDVAIKKIGQTSKDSKRLVENEVRLLHGKEHKNLINLIAWCIEENKFYLVYEYVNGCTLDEYLRENSSIPSLSWKQCLEGRGMLTMHEAPASSIFQNPDYLRYMIANNRFEEALDERLKGDCMSESDLTNALALAQLALKCADKDKEEGPDMDYVMRQLCFMRSQNTENGYSETAH
ncbi:hypothetical protein SUGI_0855080 [Cryptomeria japonica]|nr:hypothetical protein SUGI_0855080 [Cryptomeria japonica]